MDDQTLSCGVCAGTYTLLDGILDTLGEDANRRVTPFQRVMQTPLVVAVYEEFWREAGYYIASSRPFGREMDTVLALHEGRTSGAVLDLACGTGVFTRPLARRAEGVVVGVDLSRPMLRRARRLVLRDGLRNVALVRASAQALPFVDGAFADVNCCGALHLFDAPEPALAEMRRVLMPGGLLCVQTTIRPARSGGLAYILERFVRFGFFNECDLDKKIRGFGFEFIHRERHRISYTFLCRRLL